MDTITSGTETTEYQNIDRPNTAVVTSSLLPLQRQQHYYGNTNTSIYNITALFLL